MTRKHNEFREFVTTMKAMGRFCREEWRFWAAIGVVLALWTAQLSVVSSLIPDMWPLLYVLHSWLSWFVGIKVIGLIWRQYEWEMDKSEEEEKRNT